jgi:5-methylcytosine-specific restriction endonuclease McrA
LIEKFMDKETIEYIKNSLRQASVTWKGRTECLNKNRRKRINENRGRGQRHELWENNCEKCGEWYLLKDNQLEVDHIVEIGPMTFTPAGDPDWTVWIKKLYCGPENLQRLCITCHQKKTSSFNATLKFKRKDKSCRLDKL